MTITLLNSLSDKYKHLVTTFVHGKETIGYNAVSVTLLEHASRIKLLD